MPYLSKAYKKLSAIAPTRFAPFKDTVTWPGYPDATARFVNRTAQLAALQRKFEDRIAAVRKSCLRRGFTGRSDPDRTGRAVRLGVRAGAVRVGR